MGNYDSRLKILHIGKFYAPHRGGIETYLQLLCDGLKTRVSLQVIVSNEDARTIRHVVDGVSVVRVGSWVTLASSPVCPGMVAEIRRSPADIVHLHWPNPVAVTAYLASGHQGKLIISYHSDVVRQKLLCMACHPILKRALDKSSAIIASSPNYIETSPVLSAYPSRCHVIPFGIPIDNFLTADSTAVAAIREQYGSRLIVSVGRLVYYKGIEYLIEAMASIDAHLLIIGDGPLRGKLEAKAREHGVSDRVTMLGHVEDLTPYYHAADVFAFPSIARSEAFGIVQIEAMACGKPVVNTKLPSGVPFVSLDGETGFTVPPSDAGALSRALRLLLERDQLRLKFGAAARVRAEREFSVQRMTERTLQLYDRIHGRTTEQPAGEERFQRVSGL